MATLRHLDQSSYPKYNRRSASSKSGWEFLWSSDISDICFCRFHFDPPLSSKVVTLNDSIEGHNAVKQMPGINQIVDLYELHGSYKRTARWFPGIPSKNMFIKLMMSVTARPKKLSSRFKRIKKVGSNPSLTKEIEFSSQILI